MRREIAVLAGISLLWGSGWLLAPSLAQGAAPFAVSALTLFAAGCGLLGFSLTRRQHTRAIPFAGAWLLGGFLFAIPQALLILAGEHGVDGWTPLLYSLMPLLLVLPDGRWTPAMAIAPGAALVLLNGTVSFAAARMLWAPLVLAAVALQAYALFYLWHRCRGFAIARSLGWTCVFAAVPLALGSLVLDRAPRFNPSSTFWAVLAAQALFTTALPYSGMLLLLTRGSLGPARVAVSQWMQTLAAAGESLALARARPPGAVLASACVLLVCCAAVLARPRERAISLFAGGE